MLRYYRPAVLVVTLASSLLAVRDVKSATGPEPGDLRAAGKVEFPISCASSIQSEFSRGVALLHSFFYEEARRVFTPLADANPKCPLPQWGFPIQWCNPI